MLATNLAPHHHQGGAHHLDGWMLPWPRQGVNECSLCPLSDLQGSNARHGTTNPKQDPNVSPIDLIGHPWAPSTAEYKTHPKQSAASQHRNQRHYAKQTTFRQCTGNLTLAPHTRKWLHNEWGHLPSSQPSVQFIFSSRTGNVWRIPSERQ